MNTIISIWFDGWHSIDPKLVHPLPKSEWRIRWVSEIIPNHEIAVLETDGEILGFITVNFNTSELSQIFTSLSEQGRGAGSALMNWAKSKYPEGLYLFTLELNRRSRKFYRKHGFRETGFSINQINGYPSVRYEWSGA
jgi:GNAT superfamily N-acetyltransferase